MVTDNSEQHVSRVGSPTAAGREPSPSAADNSTTRPPTRKKGGRSQSPRAMERRRLKERTAAENMEDARESQSTSASQPSRSDNSSNHSISSGNTPQQVRSSSSSSSSSSSHAMNVALLTEELHKPGIALGLDSMMPEMTEGDALSSMPGLDLFSVSPACTCNGVTGPCAAHLEEIRSQVLRSPITQDSPGVARPRVSTGSSYRDSPVQPTQYMDSSPSSMELVSSHDSQPHQPLSSSNAARSVPSAMMLDGDSSKPTDPIQSSSEDSVISNAVMQNTARFKAILEVVRAAGFADFDRMAAAYYTAQFEKNSLPEITQRASRGRRLNKLLHELHECSRQWSPWESRGLREGVIESATMECIDEIERIASDHLQVRAHDSDLNKDCMDTKEVIQNSSAGALSGLPTLPDSVDSAMQDEAPFLWSLVTELAGPDGIYCNRVSHAVLALLADARRSQYS
ncbi:hypothetical protein ETB97_012278 [Aspergillus alliaceus]|uniref:Uncharacterized protein n=1 Tax=Petromyces alliaceus TaxID=209559 RepID=A0A8H6A7G3_PETAA|nr:hypothetical protein ETB97_012278 [Aspergillus burnettii]